MKTKILILTAWYLPGFRAGGPIQSLSNFVEAFSQTYDIKIFTINQDAYNTKPYPDITPNIWIKNHQGIEVFYASPDFLKTKNIISLIKSVKHDYLYLNSMYSVPFSIIPLLFCRKQTHTIILEPEGVLCRSALAIKPLKKKIFLIALKLSGIHKQIIWQATDHFEKTEIEIALGKSVNIRIAPNLPPQKQSPFALLPKKEGEIRLVYISRLHHIKNLYFALEQMAKAKGQVLLDIYGPMEEPHYWAKCQALIDTFPPEKQVRYVGELRQHQIVQTLQQYHLFCLPTLSENFGHAIFEALLAGRPILISDNTPWRNLEEKQIGWDISLHNPEKWVVALEKAVNFSDSEYQIWAKAAYQHADNYIHNPQFRAAIEALFVPI